MSSKRLIFLIAFSLVLWRSDLCVGETPIESLIPRKDIPEGWSLTEGPRFFTKKTLFKHIDGQAELFFKYGYQKSVFGAYQDNKNREDQIEVDIYDMGSALQAFGVFSRFRNEDRPGGIGLDSYLDDRSALFYSGRYFVMVHSEASNPSVLKEWAMKIASKIPGPPTPPKEISYFPKNGLKPASIQYFPEGLLGHQFLKRGFKGTYLEKVETKAKVEEKQETRMEAREFTLFLALFRDSREATGALKAYKEELSKKGEVLSGGLIQFEARALKGEDPYQGKVIVLQKGSYLLGAVGFEKEESSENLLAELAGRAEE